MENKPLFKNSLEKGYADHGETLTNLLASIAFEQNAATFYDTAVGVADLPLLEGETYVFRPESRS